VRGRLLESIEHWLVKNPEVKSTKRYMIIRDCIQRIPYSDSDDIDPSEGPEDPVCDFSIVGVHDDILPDAEILGTLAEILSKLDINDYKIRINHRKIADGIFESCGVSEDASASVAVRFAISLLRLKKVSSTSDFDVFQPLCNCSDENISDVRSIGVPIG
jgi:histidyl-tRNA synthetase